MNHMQQYLVPFIVVLLAIVFLDPLMILMPKVALYSAMAAFFILFVLYATTVWKERAGDEREYLHRAAAGRVAYLAGAGTLVVGIIYQAFVLHSVDPWLVLALAVMVLAKSGGLHYLQSRR